MTRLVPTILCGGSGTRLWPASRASYPKQFLPLLGKLSSFQDTLLRIDAPDLFAPPIVVTGEQHRFLVLHELEAVAMAADILIEPEARDSGPAILAAALKAARADPEAVVLMLAADHAIEPTETFRADCEAAARAAKDGFIVTFGIKPDRPATEYGYIRPGEPIGGHDPLRRIGQFVEKPDAGRARSFVDSGYLWNSGNFCFLARTLIEDYRRYDPATVEAVAESVAAGQPDFRFTRLGEAGYRRARRQSIDYAVMEKTDRAAVLPARFGWSDIGSWQTLWELKEKDPRGNVVSGPVTTLDVSDCYIETEDHIAAAALGVENLVVVVRNDAVLVASKDRVAEVKTLVDEMRRQKRPQATDGVRVHRPWGWYQTLDLGNRFQVKRIVVRPGGRLSLQKHHHRAEHWVVVRGVATVTIGDQVRNLHENESTYIPIGEIHRLENPGRIDLEMIEVQSGSYTGEDDIVRIEDVYRR